MTSIYLIRHGEAVGNVARTVQGISDNEITPKGYKQLECLGERAKELKLDKIYSSPLKRAVTTAQYVNKHYHYEIIIDPELIEISFGEWENRPWSEIPTLYPQQHEVWLNHMWDLAAPGGETMQQVRERIVSAVHRIATENRGRTVGIVAHGCVIKNYICYAKGLPLEKLGSIDWGENTAISKVDFDDSGLPHLEFYNDYSHLPAELTTLAKQTWWKEQKR